MSDRIRLTPARRALLMTLSADGSWLEVPQEARYGGSIMFVAHRNDEGASVHRTPYEGLLSFGLIEVERGTITHRKVVISDAGRQWILSGSRTV